MLRTFGSASSLSRRPLALFNLCLLLAALSVAASAQTGRSTLSGHVLDQNNAAVSGARVVLQRAGTGVETTASTDATGSFKFDSLAAGDYLLVASSAGFAAGRQQLSLRSDESRDLELILHAGPVAEEIAV